MRDNIEVVKCDRCGKVQKEDPFLFPLEDPDEELNKALIFFKYHDICPRCKRAVSRLIKMIKKELPKKSKPVEKFDFDDGTGIK